MITPDMLNAIFEGGLSLFIFMSVWKLHKDKLLRGVFWPMVAFTMSWGYFNLWFYPVIDQWWSFFAGIAVVTSNTIWLSQMLYYNWRERKGHKWVDGIWMIVKSDSWGVANDAPIGDGVGRGHKIPWWKFIPWKQAPITIQSLADVQPSGLGFQPSKVKRHECECGRCDCG